jgi:anti-anti-sigma factor
MGPGPSNSGSQLSFEIEQAAQETIVHCSGRIVSETCDLLRDTIRELISQGKSIVLDLSKVAFMDSAGLGTLVSVWSSAKKRAAGVDIRWSKPGTTVSGPDVKIVNQNERVQKLFRLTRLDRLFGGPDETE